MEWESRVSAGIHHWLNLCGSEPEFQLIKEKLLNLKEDLNEKLTVVVAGEFNAGKSTFINALLGSRILTSDVLPATAVVTKLTYGKSRRVIAHYRDKHMSEYDMKWLEQLTAEREGKFQQIRKKLSHIELQLPFELLKLFTIIDTPGLNSIHQEHTDTTDRFLPRADIVLWLFDYRNVSTSTEISSIKKLQGYDLEPFAIVNSIDKHEEDEEELESLLDENYRKLQRYVKKLIGVSAKDALEGKLAHDQELLKWSKWNQVEELFSSFKQLTDQKIVRIFQKLKEPLRMMDEILIGKKAELNLNHVGPLMKKFFDEEFPSLQRKAKQLDHLTVESNQKINSWNAFLNQEFEGLEKTTEFIRNANSRLSAEAQNNTGLLTDLDEKVLPQIKKFKNDYLQFEQEVNELKRERDLLNQEWKEADAASAFSRKHLRLTRHEEKQKDWNRKRVKLEKDHSQLLKLDRSIKDQFKQIGNMAEKAIIANIKETVEEQEHAAQSWNSMLTNAQQTYRTFTSADLENMRQFSEWMRSCLNGVITPFQEASAAMKDPLDFAETALLLSNIQSLYDDFPMDKLVQDFSVFQKWTKAKGVSYKIKINLPIPPEIKYKHIHFVPEKVSHDIEKAKNELIKKRREWLNWLATTAIITAIMIYAINYKDSSPSDGTAAAYEQSTNESSSSDTSSSKSSADLKENYGEDKIKDFIFSFDSERMESHTSTEFIHSVDVISDNKNSFETIMNDWKDMTLKI